MRRMQFPLRRPLALVGLVVLAAGIAGCGGSSGIPRYGVSGTVTLDGEPLDTGAIQFGPEDGQGMSGGATIQDGTYEIPAERGLPEGKYRVRISSAGEAAQPEDEMPGESLEHLANERIPPKYNVNSQETVEITPDGDNTFNFDISTKS